LSFLTISRTRRYLRYWYRTATSGVSPYPIPSSTFPDRGYYMLPSRQWRRYVSAGCLNVFGMAVGSLKTRLRRLCWSPLRAPIDTLPDCRHSGIPEFAGHLVPKQLCCFLFYQARAGACVRDKRNGAPQAVLAARGKQVAFGQTAPTSYAGRTTLTLRPASLRPRWSSWSVAVFPVPPAPRRLTAKSSE